MGWRPRTVFRRIAALTVDLIESTLAPALEESDPLDLEAAHQRMDTAVKGYPYAKAALDEALHDIKGKALGVPVYQFLGGQVREEIPIAHSLGWLEYEAATTEAAAAVSEGIKTIKIKVGRDATYDLRIVKEVREAIGPEPDIVVDANQGWPTPKYAIEIVERMREYRIRYAEQPVEGLRQMAEVRPGRLCRLWPTRAPGRHRTCWRSSSDGRRT